MRTALIVGSTLGGASLRWAVRNSGASFGVCGDMASVPAPALGYKGSQPPAWKRIWQEAKLVEDIICRKVCWNRNLLRSVYFLPAALQCSALLLKEKEPIFEFPLGNEVETLSVSDQCVTACSHTLVTDTVRTVIVRTA